MSVEAHAEYTWVCEWFAPTGYFKVRVEFTSTTGEYWGLPSVTLWQRKHATIPPSAPWTQIVLDMPLPEAPGSLEELANTLLAALTQLNTNRPDRLRKE